MIGRGPDCELVISEPKASRQHCTVERRQDRFVLQDHSTNGTYVTADGEREIPPAARGFQRCAATAGSRSASRAPSTTDIVEYFCEQVPGSARRRQRRTAAPPTGASSQ